MSKEATKEVSITCFCVSTFCGHCKLCPRLQRKSASKDKDWPVQFPTQRNDALLKPGTRNWKHKKQKNLEAWRNGFRGEGVRGSKSRRPGVKRCCSK